MELRDISLPRALAAWALTLALGLATAAEPPAGSNSVTRNGTRVDFEIRPADASARLQAGTPAEVRFRISEQATGAPVRGASPGAWMDMSQGLRARADGQQQNCKERVSMYMQGAVGLRPMIDLNSYYVLVMNAEPTLTVIDPVVSMAGSTSTLAQVVLPGPGADWARSVDQKRLYVSSPGAGKVTVVDTDSFKAVKSIAAGAEPLRTVLQPDGRYLWVGNDAKDALDSGVTVIDTASEATLAHIATGRGHHEIAFSADSARAWVSNRDEGTVAVIDTATLKKLRDLKTGPLPIALAWSARAGALYVADGKTGTVSVYGTDSDAPLATIALEPGIGPMRFAPDGRHALIANPSADAVYVIDAATNTLANTIAIAGEPFQIAFSQAFAYVRALRSERVTMIALPTLGAGRQPTVQSFVAGSEAPAGAGRLAIADSMTAAANEASVFVVNPADNTTYFYMEGMNAPSSNYKSRSGSARAVTLVDRSLKEVEPGVYAGMVTLPAAGSYDVAFMMHTPQLLHCFVAEAATDPLKPAGGPAVRVEFDETQRSAQAGEVVTLAFRMSEGASGAPLIGARDLRVMYFLAPGRNRKEVPVRELGDGRYEVKLPLAQAGAYYVHLALPGKGLGYEKLPFFSIHATSTAAGKPGGRG